MKNGEIVRARNVYERAVEKLADEEDAEQLFVAFAEFEERCKETERARQYGDKEGIEDAIVGKRRFQYEDEVRKNPLNYDAWFDYIRLEENVGNKGRIREVYERAIANVPPAEEKRYWQRYIYLWINYALYEELDAGDMERTRDVYRYLYVLAMDLCVFVPIFPCFALVPLFWFIWSALSLFHTRSFLLQRSGFLVHSLK
ncbi:hypothetical protein Gotur_011246 [Gossypium turneri]